MCNYVLSCAILFGNATQKNWRLLLDAIADNCPERDRDRVFKFMRKIAQNLMTNDQKYKFLFINHNNEMLQKSIFNQKGGMEFLGGIGYEKNPYNDNKYTLCIEYTHFD